MVAIVSILNSAGEELSAFRRLLAEYEESLDPDLRIPNFDAELRELERRYADGALFVARTAGAVVGCVLVRPIDSRTAEIKRLYVIPSGRGTGAGRALVEACIAFARAHGHQRVVLDTERHRLAAAYTLYKKLGFIERAPYAPPEYANPTYMEYVLPR